MDILGKPSPALRRDPKITNDLLKQSIENGEELAQSSLASELLMLDVAGTPRDKQNIYTGRAQYPKMIRKSLIKNNTHGEKYNCPHVSFWGHLKSTLQYSLSALKRGHTCPTESTKTIGDLFAEASLHVCDASLELIAFAHALAKPPPDNIEINIHNLQLLIQDTSKTLEFYANLLTNNLRTSYNNFVKQELHKGGGKLFSIIAQEDKAFLNVNWASGGGPHITPEIFLDKQVKTWSKFCDPHPQCTV